MLSATINHTGISKNWRMKIIQPYWKGSVVMKSQKDEFEKLRSHMELLAGKHGFLHPEVIAVSEKLDQLHNSILKTKRCKKDGHE